MYTDIHTGKTFIHIKSKQKTKKSCFQDVGNIALSKHCLWDVAEEEADQPEHQIREEEEKLGPNILSRTTLKARAAASSETCNCSRKAYETQFKGSTQGRKDCEKSSGAQERVLN